RMVQMMVGRDLNEFYVSATEHSERLPYFEVTDLRTKKYPQQPVSFDIRRGEVLGFAGLVGAGRTAVAQALFGVEKALGATIVLDGGRLELYSPQDAIAQGIYLIPEDRRGLGLILNSSIRENVTLPAISRYARAWLLRQDRETSAASEICAALDVKSSSLENDVGHLSGGNQQKVVLAKWL